LEPIVLNEGDVIAFPTGGEHKISDSPEGLKLPVENVIRLTDNDEVVVLKNGAVRFSLGDAAASAHDGTRWLSGTFSYDTSIHHPFLKGLPCFIHVGEKEERTRHVLQGLVTVLLEESKTDTPDSALAIDRLTELLFLHLLRYYMRVSTRSDGYFAALSDPHIGVALQLIHTEDDGSLTVESLCKAAAMSRTSFNALFSKLVGDAPKTYLTGARLLRAKAQLQQGRDAIPRIAETAGYSSGAAFSKAIKKHFGITPGELRKAALKVNA
jgi:AraC-like DNA-binding protein